MTEHDAASGGNPNLYIFESMPEAEQAAMLASHAKREDDGLVIKPLTELMQQEFAPVEWLVEGLVARGYLCMLAGRPKSGKSWLALQLARAIDTGGDFLGMTTRRAKVLHLALEDKEKRIYQRVNLFKWRPVQADIATVVGRFDSPNRGEGGIGPGLAQIHYVAATSGYSLIIIDTLIAALSGEANENDNTAMAAIVNALSNIADSTNTAIVLVHHTGKQYNEDPFALLRGASAIRGAYDVGIVLERQQAEREAVLHVEARDFEGYALSLSQNGDGVGWQSLGRGDVRVGRVGVELLEEHGDGLTVNELAQRSGKSPQAVRSSLETAIARGLVEANKGKRPYTYSLVEWGHKAG